MQGADQIQRIQKIQHDSSLLKLPAELRDRIYYLTCDTFSLHDGLPLQIVLKLVCRQITHEVSPHTKSPRILEMLEISFKPSEIIHRIGRRALSSIRTFERDLDFYLDVVYCERSARVIKKLAEPILLKDVFPNFKRVVLHHTDKALMWGQIDYPVDILCSQTEDCLARFERRVRSVFNKSDLEVVLLYRIRTLDSSTPVEVED